MCSLEPWQRHSQGHWIPSQTFSSITNWGIMGENRAYWRFDIQSCWILTACLCSKFSHRDVLKDGASKTQLFPYLDKFLYNTENNNVHSFRLFMITQSISKLVLIITNSEKSCTNAVKKLHTKLQDMLQFDLLILNMNRTQRFNFKHFAVSHEC